MNICAVAGELVGAPLPVHRTDTSALVALHLVVATELPSSRRGRREGAASESVQVRAVALGTIGQAILDEGLGNGDRVSLYGPLVWRRLSEETVGYVVRVERWQRL